MQQYHKAFSRVSEAHKQARVTPTEHWGGYPRLGGLCHPSGVSGAEVVEVQRKASQQVKAVPNFRANKGT